MVEVVDPASPDPPWVVLEPDPPPGAVVVPEPFPFPLPEAVAVPEPFPFPPTGTEVTLEEITDDEPRPLLLLPAVVDAAREEAPDVTAEGEGTTLVEDVLVLVLHALDDGLTLDENDPTEGVLDGLDDGPTLIEDRLTPAEDETAVVDDAVIAAEDCTAPDEDDLTLAEGDTAVAEDAIFADEDWIASDEEDLIEGVVDAIVDKKTELGVGVGVDDGMVE